MSITASPQQNHSRDVALAAIAQALEQIGRTDEQPLQSDVRPFKSEKENNATRLPSDEQSCAAEPGRGSSRGRLVSRSLTGLLALACIGVAAFAWQSTHGQTAPEPISTSSVSIKQKEPPAQPAPYNVAAKADAGLPQQLSQAQTKNAAPVPTAAPVVPITAPTVPDLAQSIQMIARELANLAQGIDQLKTGQAQRVRDNAELAEHLKATQEMARRNADLAEDLKAAQAQIARDNVSFTEQLKASQEQMADIAAQLKGSQQQIASLVASEQKQRPRPPASSPVPIANPKRQPVPTPASSQVRAQPQDSRHPQPKQQ
jgi:hypothetical protein